MSTPRASNAKAKANPPLHILILRTLLSTPSFEDCNSECLFKGSHPLKTTHLWFCSSSCCPENTQLTHSSAQRAELPHLAGNGPSTAVFKFPQMVFFGYMVFSIVLGLLADRYGRWKVSDSRGLHVLSLRSTGATCLDELCFNDPNSCPFADPAALLPLGSLFLLAGLICPILHLVCVPAGHGRRRCVRPCTRVRLCKPRPPSQRRQRRGCKGKGGQIPTSP